MDGWMDRQESDAWGMDGWMDGNIHIMHHHFGIIVGYTIVTLGSTQ